MSILDEEGETWRKLELGEAHLIREIEFQITKCYLTETIILIMYCCVVNYPKT